MTAPTPSLVRCLTVEEVHDLPVSPALITCAVNLLDHEFPEPEVSIAHYPESLPVRKLAAVLVLLYERDGQIRVLLTTRSKQLRSHPGQTALPGGRSEQDDGSPIMTALREANEEISLPLDCPNVHVLRTLPPFPSLWSLVVTPVVCILSDISVLAQLVPDPGEVHDIFDHPLEGFLDPSILKDDPNLSPIGSGNWPYSAELYDYAEYPTFEGNHAYRDNCFRSTSRLIGGLTSSILILTAETAFNRIASYQYLSDKHLPIGDAIQAIIEGKPVANTARHIY